MFTKNLLILNHIGLQIAVVDITADYLDIACKSSEANKLIQLFVIS